MRLLIASLVMLVFVALVAVNNPFVIQSAQAQDFCNARVADCGLAELGTTRPTGWDQPGECLKSVQRWVANAGGTFGFGGVISGYTSSGAVQVSATEATKGDVIQWTNGNDGDWSLPHTACIVKNNHDGTYWVVHSNWDAKGLVSQSKRWDPNPESIGRSGWYPMFWRFGSVNPPISGGHDVMGATSPATDFYFAEGSCRPGFTPYFCIQNPGSSRADVTITYMKGDSTRDSQKVTVPAASRLTISPKDRLGEGDDVAHDFSTRIACTNGRKIIAERPMYFDYKGCTGGSDVVGATAPARTFYFAEGTCRPGFDTYFCVQNPNDDPASVTLTYMRGYGSPASQKRTIPPNSRATFHPADLIGCANDSAHDFSARVECTNGLGVIAERPMYFVYNGAWNGGHDVIGATSPGADFYFAEGSCRPGFTPYFCIQNPGGTTADVSVTYARADGTSDEQKVQVAAASRLTISPKARLGEADSAAFDFSTRIACTNGQQIVAERPMYFDYKGCTGGSDVVGATSPAPAFYFAEGTCRPEFDTYFCIQNPRSSDARVRITYMRGDGTTRTQDVAVPKNSRRTVSAEAFLGVGDNASHDFSSKVECTNGQQIIVERPMFFHIVAYQ